MATSGGDVGVSTSVSNKPVFLKMPNLKDVNAIVAADLFMETERKYVERGLRVLAEMEQRLKFHNRMKMDVIKDDDINQVFLSIEGVYRFNSQLLDTLMRLRFEGMDVFLTRLGETVDRVMGFLKMYVEYVLKTKTAIARLRQLEKENTKFRDFLIINEAVAGVNLITLLQAPMERLPQYIIFFSSIFVGLPEGHPAAVSLGNTVQKMQKVMDEIANKAKIASQNERVVDCHQRVFKDSLNLIDPTRRGIMAGELTNLENKSQLMVYLFNDFLLTGTKNTFGSAYSIKDLMLIPGLRVTEVSDAAGVKFSFKIKSDIAGPALWLQADSEKTKIKWVKAFAEVIRDAMAAQQNKPMGTLTQQNMILHPDQFRKMIMKKDYDSKALIPKPAYEMPSGFSIDKAPPVPVRRAAPPVPNRFGTAPASSTLASSSSSSHSSAGPSPPTPVRSAPVPPRHASIQVESKSPYTEAALSTSTSTSTDSAVPPPPPVVVIAPEPAQEPAPEEEEWEYDASKAPDAIGDWSKLWNEDNQLFYYENIPLAITQWEPPEVYLEWRPAPPAKVPPPPPPQMAMAPPPVPVPGDAPPAAMTSSLLPPPSMMGGDGTSMPMSSLAPPPSMMSSLAPPPTMSALAPPPMMTSSLAPPPSMTSSLVPPPSMLSGLTPPPMMNISSPSSGGGVGGGSAVSGNSDLLNAIRAGASLRPVSASEPREAPVASPQDQLLASIRAGTNLRKMDPATDRQPALPSFTSPQMDLLASIRAGTKLKKVETVEKSPRSESTGIRGALEKSLANYRKFVQDDDDEDNDDDEEDW